MQLTAFHEYSESWLIAVMRSILDVILKHPSQFGTDESLETDELAHLSFLVSDEQKPTSCSAALYSVRKEFHAA